jgi:hypothetical protein
MRWWIGLLCAALCGCGGGPAAPDDLSFTGRWTGTYIVRGCTTVGWPSCDGLERQVDHVYALDVSLTQSGSAVSGTAQVTDSNFWTIPVTGTATTNSLTVAGTFANPVLNLLISDTVRITGWSTTRDDSGRLHGTFVFRRESLWGPADIEHRVGQIWTVSYNAELMDVTRAR